MQNWKQRWLMIHFENKYASTCVANNYIVIAIFLEFTCFNSPPKRGYDTKVHSLSKQFCTRIFVSIKWQLMSALNSLERFGEEDPFFIKWRSCRHCLQSEWPLRRKIIQKILYMLGEPADFFFNFFKFSWSSCQWILFVYP